MNRILSLLILTIIITGQSLAQIVITSADMPAPGDTLRKSLTAILDGIDFEQAGPDQSWMFDELTVVSQQVDTFVSVEETPPVYQFFFNNQFVYPEYKSTVAQKLPEFTAIPTLELTDTYLFVKNSSQDIREVGYGVTLAGIPLPIQFQQVDTVYHFPLEYGDVDSSHSFFEIDLPDLGYLLISKFRKNTVDAWGTLTTPFGSFQTIRVKTEIQEYDSLYSDSLGMGMPLNRNITEYKWLAQGFPEPVLQVTQEGFLVTASYVDSVRSVFLSTQEPGARKFDFSVYPNPCSDYLSVSYELVEDASVMISIFSIYGNEMKRFVNANQERGLYNRVLYLKESGFRNGIYLLRVTIDNVPYIRRILLN